MSIIRATQAQNEQLVNNVNDGLIVLSNSIIKKEILENENWNKIVDIVEKSLNFNKQEKGIKTLTPKQIAGNTSIKFTTWNRSNHIFFVLKKRSY